MRTSLKEKVNKLPFYTVVFGFVFLFEFLIKKDVISFQHVYKETSQLIVMDKEGKKHEPTEKGWWLQRNYSKIRL